MKVEDILRRKGTRINTVRVNEPIETALRLMASENIGALVVKDVCRTEGNTVVGVISERDVVRGLVQQGPTVLKQTVATLMSKNPICCAPGDSIRHVLSLMDKHSIRHVPVLEGMNLIGVISVRDFIKTQLEALPEDESETPLAAAE
ncbi:CBS domain-containing protein [Azospirillum sp. SYSU D00513]|uniref:CBS domain-containing protein n=1 Tax=Azospirillum sp. SYSU D00513 TaxID=2812561 RepID=UPI001A97C71A|nr:CBS domain-containing protein [Azospirillum sp. SYSU D00513]